MRTHLGVLAAVLSGAPAAFADPTPSPILAGGTLDPVACTYRVHRARFSEDLTIPLRFIRWTFAKRPDDHGTSAPYAIGTCAKKRACIHGTAENHTTDIPHELWKVNVFYDNYTLRLPDDTPAKTRAAIRELNAFAKSNCSTKR